MKITTLSLITTLALSATSASALTLYQDPATGQVFTKSAEGRIQMGDFIDAKTVYLENQAQDSAIAKKYSKHKDIPVYAKASKFKFSGTTYIGYKSTNYSDSTEDDQRFEIRRGYFQLKAYLLDDPKSYYRVTFDLKQEKDSDGNLDGSMVVRAKYAYLNLNEVLPYTSFEIGLAHRPWHDYEEHNSWLYRSVSEVLVENHNSAHLSNSADFGVMAKTRTKFLDADIGIFNGEGYHSAQNSNGMSLEWRFTGHLLGTKGHPEKNTYADVSFFGQLNKKHYSTTVQGTAENDDLKFYGLHAVYNMPAFLMSAQYITSSNTALAVNEVSKGAGKGYSFNVEGRLGAEHEYKAFARLDKWTPDNDFDKNTYIAGLAWKQNKNVEWVINTTINDNDHAAGTPSPKDTSFMLTAEVNF